MIAEIKIGDDSFHNISLRCDPALAHMQDADRADYIANLQRTYQLEASLAKVGKTIDFSSNRWDLTPILSKGEKAANTVLIFKDLPDDVIPYVKFFLNYYRKKNHVKVNTLYIRYTNIKKILTGILKSDPNIRFDGITTGMIENFIDSRNLSNEAKRNYYTSILKFYNYLITTCKIRLLVDLDSLSSKLDNTIKAVKHEDTRLPSIPRDVAKKIEAKALEVMRGDNYEYRYRLIACAIIMLFRLGVRINDLMDFRVDNLKKDKIEVHGVKISYIDYYISKLSRHNSEAFGHSIFASDDTVEAFETMKRIRLTQIASEWSDHLFLEDNQEISKTYFSHLYHLYMYIFHPDICSTNKYSEVFKSYSSCKFPPAKGKTIYCPDTRQYRVYLCTDLYAKGVSWKFIEEHLKHLSSTMINYYNRPEDKTPEYVAYAENVLSTILIDKIEPIGVAGKAIRSNIEKFLQENNINAVKNFDEVLNVLGDKVAIRAKTGGFCFKTSLIPCSQEVGTNKHLCAYNLCPNVYSFYYMLDYTYAQFKAHVEAYEQNTIKGLKHSAQKERVEIQSLIFRTFEPQLKQLEDEIKRSGFKAIVEKHPNIIDIANNLNNIKKQLTEWKRKIEK